MLSPGLGRRPTRLWNLGSASAAQSAWAWHVGDASKGLVLCGDGGRGPALLEFGCGSLSGLGMGAWKHLCWKV